MALDVVFTHAFGLGHHQEFYIPFCGAPVPAFLAISGFLVLRSYETTGSWGRFIWKRALRVLPALFLSFLLVWALEGPDKMRLAVLGWLTMTQAAGTTAPNPPLWSLGWEEIAYAMLAILFALGAYRKPILVAALLVASFVLASFVLSFESNLAYAKLVAPLAPAFFAGNLIYLWRDRIPKTPGWAPYLALGLASLAYEFVFPPEALILASTLYAIAVVWVGVAGFPWVRHMPDFSYGVYVYHMPTMIWLAARGLDSFWPLMGATVGATLLLAGLSWYAVEKPFLALKNWRPRARPAL